MCEMSKVQSPKSKVQGPRSKVRNTFKVQRSMFNVRYRSATIDLDGQVPERALDLGLWTWIRI